MLRELNSSVATSRGRAKARRQRWIRTISISILMMAVLFGGVGLAYVWYMDTSRPVTPVAMPTPTTNKLTQPVAAPPEGPVGVSVQALSSPVKPGGNASLTIRTRPSAACSIRVTYKEQLSADSGLIPKTADQYGLVQWTWTVEAGRPVGVWPVEVTCALGKQSGYVRGDLEVANS